MNGRKENYLEMHACVSELTRLSCLRTLEVKIPDPYVLPEDVPFDNLTRYDICIGCERKGYCNDEKTSRRLKLN